MDRNKKQLFFKPCLVVLSGVPLTGKTVLAEKLVALSNLSIIDVDIVRNEIDESRKKDGQIRMLEPELEKAVMIRAYMEMCRQSAEKVNRGIPVVIAGTFSRAEFKRPLEQLVSVLKRKEIPLKVFFLTVPDNEALERIEKRKKGGGLSNIDSLEKYQWAKGIFSKIEFAPVIEIDASKSDHFEKIIENLKDLQNNK